MTDEQKKQQVKELKKLINTIYKQFGEAGVNKDPTVMDEIHESAGAAFFASEYMANTLVHTLVNALSGKWTTSNMGMFCYTSFSLGFETAKRWYKDQGEIEELERISKLASEDR